jgi:hypothetical protein
MDTDSDEIFSNAKPIATVEQFKTALLAVAQTGIPKKHREMLMAHCRADKPDKHTISTGQLAKEVGYPDHNTVNIQYGKLAHRVADELHIILPETPDKKPHWWRTLAIGKYVGPEPYLWRMRRELVQALRELKWA